MDKVDYDNPKEIYIARELNGIHYLLFLDEPTLEEDGVFRSPQGVWSRLQDFRWMIHIEKGKYKKYKLVEDEIPVTNNQQETGA